MIGALVAAGVPPWFMVAHSRGEVFEGLAGPDGRPAAEADRSAGARLPGPPRPARASAPARCGWRSRALLEPARATRRSRWSPAGCRRASISTDSLKEIVRRAVPGGWVDHPNYWAVACDYETGRRTPFGRSAPRAPTSPTPWPPPARSPASTARSRSAAAATWTAASARPRTSTCVAGRGLDLVICLNPLTSQRRGLRRSATPLDCPGASPAARRAAGGSSARSARCAASAPRS